MRPLAFYVELWVVLQAVGLVVAWHGCKSADPGAPASKCIVNGSSRERPRPGSLDPRVQTEP